HPRAGGANGPCADAGAVLRRPSARSCRVEGPQVGMGRLTSRERRLRRAFLCGRRRAEVWFYQAIGASPAMFRRKPGSGSLYWLGLRDNAGAYLDGGKTYRLTVPQPVPGKLFWSVTAYDAETRSQVQTDQGKAALRSLFELKDKAGENSVDLYFGPNAPAGKEGQWIKTNPGKGWFGYFRIYGPEQAAFDGSWKPGDFEEVVANTASPSRPRHCRPTPNAVKPEYAADWQLRGRPYRLETANAPRHTVTSLLCDAQCGRGDSQSTVDGRRGKHLD